MNHLEKLKQLSEDLREANKTETDEDLAADELDSIISDMEKEQITKGTIRQLLHAESLLQKQLQEETPDNRDLDTGETIELLFDIIKSDLYQETKPKFCPQCQEITASYFELDTCDKNPEGLVNCSIEHGNDIEGTITCEDDYCNPQYEAIDPEDIESVQWLKDHEVHERCSSCEQFREAM